MIKGHTGYAGVVHTPREISIGGCSYSIKATDEKFRKALEYSKENNIKIRGIFKEVDKNKYAEVII